MGWPSAFALVDRRQAAPEQHLAAKVQFLRGFVAGVDPAGPLQPFEFALVDFEPLRLAIDRIGNEPSQSRSVTIDATCSSFEAFGIRIVDSRQELPVMLGGQQVDCGAPCGYFRRGACRSATVRSG